MIICGFVPKKHKHNTKFQWTLTRHFYLPMNDWKHYWGSLYVHFLAFWVLEVATTTISKKKKKAASYHTQKKKHHFLFTITYLLVICRWSLISQQSSYSVMSQRKQRKILLNLLLTSCKDLCHSLLIFLELPIIDVYK